MVFPKNDILSTICLFKQTIIRKKVEIVQSSVHPVSYTHLDVYKRQPYMTSIF